MSFDRASLFSRCRRIVIKMGSAILTRPQGLDRANLHRLSDQITEIRIAGREIVLVSSGAVAAGRSRLGHAERPKTIAQKQSAAAVGQPLLMQAWEEAFHKHDTHVAQLLLTADDIRQRQRYLNSRQTLETLLEWGVIPIINENDTVSFEEIKFGDNDQLAALVAGLIGADLVILLTDIDGLFDKDPRSYPDASRIPLVSEIDASLLAATQAPAGAVGTGGMRSKILAAQKCLESGIPLVIAPGRQREILPRLLAGEELGTIFVPTKRALSGRKRWLAHLPKPAGFLHLDRGAVDALLHAGRSLLPIGITLVGGSFERGSPVSCLSPEGEEIGIGLANYSSAEIDKIKGHKSESIESLIGYRYADEVIHRNAFVLTSERLPPTS